MTKEKQIVKSTVGLILALNVALGTPASAAINKGSAPGARPGETGSSGCAQQHSSSTGSERGRSTQYRPFRPKLRDLLPWMIQDKAFFKGSGYPAGSKKRSHSDAKA